MDKAIELLKDKIEEIQAKIDILHYEKHNLEKAIELIEIGCGIKKPFTPNNLPF